MSMPSQPIIEYDFTRIGKRATATAANAPQGDTELVREETTQRKSQGRALSIPHQVVADRVTSNKLPQ
jgi:hypothetical protein